MPQDNIIEVFCTDHGAWERGKGMVRPQAFEARLAFGENSTPPYFRGTGKSATEAIGALICRVPEKFNARIVVEPEQKD